MTLGNFCVNMVLFLEIVMFNKKEKNVEEFEKRANNIKEEINSIETEIAKIKSDGITLRCGNSVIKFSFESESQLDIEEEIKNELKDKIRKKILSLKEYVEEEMKEMQYIVSNTKSEYEKKEKELKERLALNKPMPNIFMEHARMGVSCINSRDGITWLVRRVYSPKFVDGKRIEPAYVKKMMTGVILLIRTNVNDKVIEVSTRNVGDLEYFQHYHQSSPDCWGNFKPYDRIISTPEDALALADDAMAVLENVNTASIAKRNPIKLPRLDTLRNHILKDDENADIKPNKNIEREYGTNLNSDSDNVWNTSPF